ncbi:MAG: Ig-like domain-containing protein, partial [bacterium]|nr:Ig-like domain-containing protein [bacterium]
MIKSIWSIIVLLCGISHVAIAETGDFFNVTGGGIQTRLNINLCLNGKGPLTCENHTITGQKLSIHTLLANQNYPIAGIKINTPGYKPTGCSQIANGYCLFSISSNKPQAIIVSPALGKNNQTIRFTSTPPTNTTTSFTYKPIAISSSGLPVSLKVNPSSAGICSLNNGVVSFSTFGNCILDATQAGNENYNPAPQVQQSITVAKGNQTINFISTPPGNVQVGGGNTYIPKATATSTLTVAITVDASSTNICSINNGTVSFQKAGICILDASQVGDSNYNPAPQVQQSITVAKGNQNITFTSSPPSNIQIGGGTTYTPTATSTSGLTVTFTVDSSSANVCSINQGVVSFQAAGTCTLNANQPGDNNYYASLQEQQSFQVFGNQSTITSLFSSQNPSIDNTSVTFTAQVSSGSDTPPDGSVSFIANNSITLCSAVVLNSGVATCTTSTLAIDSTNIITATYSGSIVFGSSV